MALGLKDRVALVTGASKGMGFAVADGFASHGARVCMIARSADRLTEAAEAVAEEHGTETIAIDGDVCEPALADRAVAEVMDRWGRLDILVNNAGGPPPGDFRDWSRDDWIKALDANMLTPIAMIKALVPGMMERGWGRVVNITSQSVKAPIAVLGLSNSARAGLTGYVAGTSRQVAASGVTMNNLLPGIHATTAIMKSAIAAIQ